MGVVGMKPMKTNGLSEIRSALRRATRLHALRRIGEEDFRFLEVRLKECEARIIAMWERLDGEEEF